MAENGSLSVQMITDRRKHVEEYYRSMGYSYIYRLCIVFCENAMFSDELIHMTGVCTNVWLYAMDQNRMFLYENQPLEFDGLCELLESVPVSATSRKDGILFAGGTVPWVTLGLIFVNVVLYFVPVFTGTYDSVIEGGMNQYAYVVGQGQFYRLFTSMFLHGGVSHLVNNMVVLLALGYYLEPALGHIQYSIIYGLSGIAGSLCSIFLRMSDAGSIGASGAIFGLVGALLGLVLFFRGRIPGISVRRVIYMCIASLYGGFATANVDNEAHIGGLVFGFLLVIITNLFYKRAT
jgi:rhomboid protease GluP